MPPMRESVVRGVGLGAALLYAVVIVWIYTRQPATLAQIRGGMSASIGAYQVNAQAFAEGLGFFRADRFVEARVAFQRADPAERDALTQFYIAYSYYRQGWHRLYSDDALFAEGLKAAEKAVALDPEQKVSVAAVDLQLRTPLELRAELESGLKHEPSDFNPLRLLGGRK
jgi:tetratricopeptide (TPR) repeat protein